MKFLPRFDIYRPCGFQNTFFECPPDHQVEVHFYGFTRAHAQRRAERWVRAQDSKEES